MPFKIEPPSQRPNTPRGISMMVDLRSAQDIAGVGQALGLKGLEQTRGCPPRDCQRQFPAEIEGVLHASVHALPACGGVHVGGVASEEGPPDLEMVGHPLVERQLGSPCWIADLDMVIARLFTKQFLESHEVDLASGVIVKFNGAVPLAGEIDEDGRDDAVVVPPLVHLIA